MKALTKEDVNKDISVAEGELLEPDLRAFRLWERIRIAPVQWSQEQYSGHGQFLVVGVLGNRCLYYNDVEGGWGWGQYEQWGKVSEYHWQDLAIQHLIFQTLFAIDNGGSG